METEDRSYPPDTNDTLAEEAYNRISDMILGLQLKPGALISETMISNYLGIGRTPVREGIKRLKRDRLVEIMPRRGIIVTEIDISDQLMALEVRRAVERLLVTRAARRSTSLQRQQILGYVERLRKAADTGDAAGYLAVDREYDALLDLCAGNVYASDSLRSIHGVARRFWATMKGTSEWAQMTELHIQLVSGVGSGKPDEAEKALNALHDYNETILRALAA